jgi:oxygen-independent coproporphyrinogen-3 oxidase
MDFLKQEERGIYRRYAALALPRHTSYPIATAWGEAYGPAEFRADLRQSASLGRPLSLYVHVPFCPQLCYYCACTKEIVPPAKRAAHDPAGPFLDRLEEEADRFAALVDTVEVRQVHLGGGSPNFLTPPQFDRLWTILIDRFTLGGGPELSVELDPRTTTLEQLQTLSGLGFNRVSLGIQDFDPSVQRAVNRVQPYECVERVLGWCRELGIPSINFDLIYGLPFQTAATMADTLEQVTRLAPDRIAFYRLAVIPEMFRWQNVFRAEDLPGGDLSLDLNLLAINRFVEAGYEFIGLDHFARPDEGLARARRAGTLQRNFQGMTTGAGLGLIGLGPSAISQLDDAFAQNAKTTGDWGARLAHDLATERGVRLSADDRLRREVLRRLYGFGRVDKRQVEERHAVAFDAHFASERRRLGELADDGLVTEDAREIRLTAPLGRLLVRVVAAVFDAYLPANAYREGLPTNRASRVG